MTASYTLTIRMGGDNVDSPKRLKALVDRMVTELHYGEKMTLAGPALDFVNDADTQAARLVEAGALKLKLTESQTNDRVGRLWAEGKKGESNRLSTDGQTVWSYSHLIGYTAPDGRKVGIDCHYSNTTTAHCSALIGHATELRRCPHHPASKGQREPVALMVDEPPEEKR